MMLGRSLPACDLRVPLLVLLVFAFLLGSGLIFREIAEQMTMFMVPPASKQDVLIVLALRGGYVM